MRFLVSEVRLCGELPPGKIDSGVNQSGAPKIEVYMGEAVWENQEWWAQQYARLFIFSVERGEPLSTLHALQRLTYRGTPLTRKRKPLGTYRRPMPRVLGGS